MMFDIETKNEPTRTLCVAEANTDSYETSILTSRTHRDGGGTMPRLRPVLRGNDRANRSGSHYSVLFRRPDDHVQWPSRVRVLQSKEG